MKQPVMQQFGRFYAVGCPQFADPAQMCPGLAWERLKEVKESLPISSPYDFEVGLKVYPREFQTKGGAYYCMAGIPLDVLPTPLPLGYFAVEIPENLYAIFDIPTLDDLAQSFSYIENVWLPNSDYLACHGYAFEKITPIPEITAQIWLPVSGKADEENRSTPSQGSRNE